MLCESSEERKKKSMSGCEMGKENLPVSGSRYECTCEPFDEQSGRRGVNTLRNDPLLGESEQASGSFLTAGETENVC